MAKCVLQIGRLRRRTQALRASGYLYGTISAVPARGWAIAYAVVQALEGAFPRIVTGLPVGD